MGIRGFKHLRFYGSNTLSPKLTKKLIHRNMQMITIVVMAYVFSVQQGISQGVKKIKCTEINLKAWLYRKPLITPVC